MKKINMILMGIITVSMLMPGCRKRMEPTVPTYSPTQNSTITETTSESYMTESPIATETVEDGNGPALTTPNDTSEMSKSASRS